MNENRKIHLPEVMRNIVEVPGTPRYKVYNLAMKKDTSIDPLKQSNKNKCLLTMRTIKEQSQNQLPTCQILDQQDKINTFTTVNDPQKLNKIDLCTDRTFNIFTSAGADMKQISSFFQKNQKRGRSSIYSQMEESLISAKKYQIVGRKQFLAFEQKLRKAKANNYGNKHKLSQTYLSFSKISSNRGNNHNETVTKDDLYDLYNIGEGEKQGKILLKQEQIEHLKTNNINNSKQYTKSLPKQQFITTVHKINQKHKIYKKLWNKNKAMNINMQNLKQLELNSLRQHKQNISPRVWPQNLRDPKQLSQFYNNKYVEMLNGKQDCPLRLKGHKKITQEIEWLKKKSSHYFQATDDFKPIITQMKKSRRCDDFKFNDVKQEEVIINKQAFQKRSTLQHNNQLSGSRFSHLASLQQNINAINK